MDTQYEFNINKSRGFMAVLGIECSIITSSLAIDLQLLLFYNFYFIIRLLSSTRKRTTVCRIPFSTRYTRTFLRFYYNRLCHMIYELHRRRRHVVNQ